MNFLLPVLIIFFYYDFEILQVVAAEDPEDGFIGIKQLLRLLRPVDEKAAGHMLSDLLYDRNALLIELKLFAEHAVLLDGRKV